MSFSTSLTDHVESFSDYLCEYSSLAVFPTVHLLSFLQFIGCLSYRLLTAFPTVLIGCLSYSSLAVFPTIHWLSFLQFNGCPSYSASMLRFWCMLSVPTEY